MVEVEREVVARVGAGDVVQERLVEEGPAVGDVANEQQQREGRAADQAEADTAQYGGGGEGGGGEAACLQEEADDGWCVDDGVELEVDGAAVQDGGGGDAACEQAVQECEAEEEDQNVRVASRAHRGRQGVEQQQQHAASTLPLAVLPLQPQHRLRQHGYEQVSETEQELAKAGQDGVGSEQPREEGSVAVGGALVWGAAGEHQRGGVAVHAVVDISVGHRQVRVLPLAPHHQQHADDGAQQQQHRH